MADLTRAKWLIALGSTAAAMALTLALNPFQHPFGFSTDAFAYLGHAHQLLRDGAFNLGPDSAYSWATSKALPAGTPNFYTPPVYIAILAAALGIWDNWHVALLLNAVIFAGTIYLGLALLPQRSGRFTRLAFAAAMALDPAYLLYNGGVQLDTLAAFLILAFILLWLQALNENNFWKFAGAGLCGAAACLTRGNALPVIGVMGLLALTAHLPRWDRKKIAGMMLTGLIGLVLLGGWAWRTEQITGRWSPTGSGNAGTMLSLNFSLSGPRASPIEKVWPDEAAHAYAHQLAAQGVPPLTQEVDTDKEASRQVMNYISGHKLWAAQIFAMSNLRLFLASEFAQPSLIAARLGGGVVASTISNLYVFGTRGLLLAGFLVFPWLIWRGAAPREFLWIWLAALTFALLTAFVAPGADRYRLPIEPLCVLILALCLTHARNQLRGATQPNRSAKA